MPNPLLGILLHAIGGFAAGSFYAPLKKVRRWAWESSWLVLGIAAWLVSPWVVAYITTPDLLGVLGRADWGVLRWTCLWGLLWGIGGLTYGLAVRYLGMALGCTVALAFCMLFGTLIPPLQNGELAEMAGLWSGQVIFAGLAVCLLGIVVCGWAGVRKDRELTVASDGARDQEFKLGWGLAVAVFAGIMSSCFAFGLDEGDPIAALAEAAGTKELYRNNVVLVVILIGGFTSNAVWCLILNFRNKTFGDYTRSLDGRQVLNLGLSTLGGVVWYFQFFFYGMGTTKLGDYDFSSWSIHMAFIIVFSNLWGLYFHEWRGTSRRTKNLVWVGILTLIGSTMVIGYGNYLEGQGL